jgi:hypothetical protein
MGGKREKLEDIVLNLRQAKEAPELSLAIQMQHL